MTVDQLMDATAVRLRAEDVGGVRVTVNLRFTDVGQEWRTRISNRTMQTVPGFSPEADVTVELDREVIIRIVAGESTAADAIAEGRAEVEGDAAAFTVLFEHLDVFMSMFPVVEP